MGKNLLTWFIKLIIILILGLIAFGVAVHFSGSSCIKTIDRSLPAVESAEWVITTPMHQYYADTVSTRTDANGVVSVTMTGWYEKSGSKWIKQKLPITLDRKNYGKITVERRIK